MPLQQKSSYSIIGLVLEHAVNIIVYIDSAFGKQPT